MRVRSGDKVKSFRTVWMEGSVVKIIDQSKLPHYFEIIGLRDYKATAVSISDMNIRGAGAIGAAAGYAMAQAVLAAPDENDKLFLENIKDAASFIKRTRPTAQNLFYAVDKVLDAVFLVMSEKKDSNIFDAKILAKKTAQQIADEDAESCRKIGEHGEKLIKDGYKVLTHCNAGWLAFVDYGSALSPVYAADKKGKGVFVYVDETRPRLQGSRLTAWELNQEGIDHRIIADNVSGWLMQRGDVDMVIVGADRIAANGDVANKIGTYEKAVLAKENKIPFYVAAPTSTFDLGSKRGKKITIEQRDEKEVLCVQGYCERTQGLEEVRVSPKQSNALNYAFDITPAQYIRGIITEKGIIKADKREIKKILS